MTFSGQSSCVTVPQFWQSCRLLHVLPSPVPPHTGINIISNEHVLEKKLMVNNVAGKGLMVSNAVGKGHMVSNVVENGLIVNNVEEKGLKSPEKQTKHAHLK